MLECEDPQVGLLVDPEDTKRHKGLNVKSLDLIFQAAGSR